MKLTIATATVITVLALVFSASPGMALQPTPIDIAGRVVSSSPVFNMFGIEISLLTVRSGGMLYTLTCYSESCRQIPRGTPVLVHARLWSDFSVEKSQSILSLDVFSVETR